MIFIYYKQSKFKVKYNGKFSDTYQANEGCKQGGILSPFLFNFFMDDLISEILASGIGARYVNLIVAIIAYCDDIILMAGNITHMKQLIEICVNYARKWKIEFNPKKSCCLNLGGFDKKSADFQFKLDGIEIPNVSSFQYLGLPIGSEEATNEFLDEKFTKVENAFYSLNGIGCKPNTMHPYVVAFFYKQYCQSIFRYSLENLHLNTTQLKHFENRQNNLLRGAIGLSKYCLMTPLLQCVNVDSMQQLYMKHKILFYNKISNNRLVKEILQNAESANSHKFSFVRQVRIAESFLNTRQAYQDRDLIANIYTIFGKWKEFSDAKRSESTGFCRMLLNNALRN